MHQLHWIDIGLLSAYFIYLLVVTFSHYRGRAESAESFLLADRSLTLWPFVATLVTTWYGGILGVGEFSYSYGLSNWLVFGVPYYLYALIFALFLAGRARRTMLFTIPDQLTRVYGQKAGWIGAFFVFITALPAGYVLMIGQLMHLLFGWELSFSIVVGAFFSMVYVWSGGLRSVVKTDMLQFVLMFGGFALMVGLMFYNYGGLSFLRANLPADHFVWHGGKSGQYIAVWYFLAMSTLVEPAFYQRCFAAKSEQVARRGILISIGCWILFDFMSTFAGLYARAILPDLAEPVQAYPAIALQILPPVAKGLFMLALFATIMSTIDSYAFIAAETLGRDVLWQWRGERDERRLNQFTRFGLLITAILTIILALWFKSVIDAWHDIGSFVTPALLIPLGVSFSERWRMQPRFAMAAMISAGAISFIWLMSAHLPGAEGAYFFGIEPIFPGLLLSAAIFVADRLNRRLA